MKKNHKIFKSGSLLISSEADMIALGRELADALEAGDVLGFVGELGAGKTHLIQGILEGLGTEHPAASPTFALAHEHTGGRLPVVHFDFYRLQSPDEAMGMGWDEYLQSDAVLLIEWADRFDGCLMPPETHWVLLRHHSPGEREVILPEEKN